MRSLGSWFSGGIDSVRLMVGHDDLEGLLQPKWFYDPMILPKEFANVCLMVNTRRCCDQLSEP